MNLRSFVQLTAYCAGFTFILIEFSPSHSANLYNAKFIILGRPTFCIPIFSGFNGTNKCTPRNIFPALHPQTTFFSPLGSKIAGEGFMQDGCFAGFKAVQGIEPVQ